MALAGWLEPLPDAAQQRELDEWAIETLNIPGPELMERAGTGLARVISELAPGAPVAVLAGKGNNGGDGLIAARVLRERGHQVTTFEPGSYVVLDGAEIVVDALLGTGFRGSPRDWAASAIDVANQAREQGATLVACDIPSGVDGSTGEVAAAAVRAHLTVSFHAAKLGLWLSPGKDYAGEVTIVDIGIPEKDQPVELSAGLLTERVLELVPRRGAASTKFSSGHVLIVGGSERYTGAPSLTAMAAARAGAGYVTVTVPEQVMPVLQAKLLEPMVRSQADLLDAAAQAQALVVGPGLGRTSEAVALVRGLARQAEQPLLVDADGLFAFNGELGMLADRKAETVLTPHAGELGRLLACSSDEINAHRLEKARQAAEVSGAVVVLKGDDTIITNGTRTAVSPGGVPALATAGTGDVLSGVVGGYLAKGMAAFEAACAGVYAHLRAGAHATAQLGSGEGVIASDVISSLAGVLN